MCIYLLCICKTWVRPSIRICICFLPLHFPSNPFHSDPYPQNVPTIHYTVTLSHYTILRTLQTTLCCRPNGSGTTDGHNKRDGRCASSGFTDTCKLDQPTFFSLLYVVHCKSIICSSNWKPHNNKRKRSGAHLVAIQFKYGHTTINTKIFNWRFDL